MASNDLKQMEKQETDSLKLKDFMIGAIIGGIVGGATALLLAPKSGKELRSDLNGQVGSLIGKTDHLRAAVTQKGNELAAATKEKTIQLKSIAVEKGGQIVETVKEKTDGLKKKVDEKKEEVLDEEFI